MERIKREKNRFEITDDQLDGNVALVIKMINTADAQGADREEGADSNAHGDNSTGNNNGESREEEALDMSSSDSDITVDPCELLLHQQMRRPEEWGTKTNSGL